MTGYKMNFATKTITITKAFAVNAAKPNTAEANLLRHLNTLVPDLKVAYKTHYSNGSHPNKGLTYRRMKEYINYHENATEIMQAYTTIRDIAKLQNNPHNYVCRWFRKQFPNYTDIPVLNNGLIAAVPVITATKEETVRSIGDVKGDPVEISREAA